MLILARLTEVSRLVVYLCQWLQTMAAKGVAAAMANNECCGSTIASLFFIAAGTSLSPRTVQLFQFSGLYDPETDGFKNLLLSSSYKDASLTKFSQRPD